MSHRSDSHSAMHKGHSKTSSKVPAPHQTHLSSSESAYAYAANSKTGHSPSPSSTPVEIKEYNKLVKNTEVQKAIRTRDKLGELLGRPLHYGATKKEVEIRTGKIEKYEKILEKCKGLLSKYDQAKVHYEQFNPKLKGGRSVRRNNASNRRKGSRANNKTRRFRK